jgi:hypothetical protein
MWLNSFHFSVQVVFSFLSRNPAVLALLIVVLVFIIVIVVFACCRRHQRRKAQKGSSADIFRPKERKASTKDTAGDPFPLSEKPAANPFPTMGTESIPRSKEYDEPFEMPFEHDENRFQRNIQRDDYRIKRSMDPYDRGDYHSQERRDRDELSTQQSVDSLDNFSVSQTDQSMAAHRDAFERTREPPFPLKHSNQRESVNDAVYGLSPIKDTYDEPFEVRKEVVPIRPLRAAPLSTQREASRQNSLSPRDLLHPRASVIRERATPSRPPRVSSVIVPQRISRLPPTNATALAPVASRQQRPPRLTSVFVPGNRMSSLIMNAPAKEKPKDGGFNSVSAVHHSHRQSSLPTNRSSVMNKSHVSTNMDTNTTSQAPHLDLDTPMSIADAPEVKQLSEPAPRAEPSSDENQPQTQTSEVFNQAAAVATNAFTAIQSFFTKAPEEDPNSNPTDHFASMYSGSHDYFSNFEGNSLNRDDFKKFQQKYQDKDTDTESVA